MVLATCDVTATEEPLVTESDSKGDLEVSKTTPIERRRVPEVGENPSIDALRPLPDELHFGETAELKTERLALADWLITHADNVEFALDSPSDTPELAELQLHWGHYADVSQTIVDRIEDDSDRSSALVGMLIDHALIYYDCGLTRQFWERVEDILAQAEGYRLTDRLPQLERLRHIE
jgi:hypothetical protein